jgi:hypothetical protein
MLATEVGTVDKELFEAGLGIEEPLHIDEAAFDTGEGELHIRVNFRRGGKFACPECPEGGLIAVTLYHAGFSALRAFGNSKTPLYFTCHNHHGIR